MAKYVRGGGGRVKIVTRSRPGISHVGGGRLNRLTPSLQITQREAFTMSQTLGGKLFTLPASELCSKYVSRDRLAFIRGYKGI